MRTLVRLSALLLVAVTACTSSSETPRAVTTPSPSGVAVTGSPSPPADAASPRPSPTPDTSYGVLDLGEPPSWFVPTSVSFVSTRTGWFLGTSACGHRRCGVLYRTRDGGRTFTRVRPPPVLTAHIRFADLNEGWAFGGPDPGNTRGDPGLWRTHDGARTWQRVLHRPVSALEVGAGLAWAVVLDEGGTSPQVLRGTIRGDGLQHVTEAGNRSAALTLGHGTVYVVAQQGAGPIATSVLVIRPDGSQLRYPSPCDGTPQIAAGAAHRLLAVCPGEPAAGTETKRVYASTDDGHTWTRRPDAPIRGYAGPFLGGSLAATSTRTFLSGGRSPLYRETAAGSWRIAIEDHDGNGFSYVGFTDDRQGVALGQQAAWMTADGGTSWRRLQFG